VQGSWCRVQGSGFRAQGPGFRVQGSGSRVHDSERGAERVGSLNTRLRINKEREEIERGKKERDTAIEREKSSREREQFSI